MNTVMDQSQAYKILSQNISEVVIMLDSELQARYISPSAAMLFGYSAEELHGQNWMKLFAPDPCRQFEAVVRDLLAQRGLHGNRKIVEMSLVRKDLREIRCQVKLLPEQNCAGNERALIAVLEDVTAVSELNAEMHKLEVHLMQTQRLEAIGALAGGVAHDFNNILTTILGYCDVLLRELHGSGHAINDIRQIRAVATRGESLVRQLLLFSRRQSIKPIAVDVNAVFFDMLKMLERLIGEDITISTECDENLWSIQADPGRIEQIIMNLVVNARDAMPEGGMLQIATENVTLGREACSRMDDVAPGDYVRITVADTGTGIDQEILDKIFEPFFSTKVEGDGAGLGLATVYSVVMQYKGWITVTSDPGEGTSFIVYLPAMTAKPSAGKKLKSVQSKIKGNAERILLVEDDDSIRDVFSKTLQDHNYVVVDTASAEEALEIFDADEQGFQLLLSDVVLPNKNGLELVALLHERQPELKVILCSGYTDEKSHWPVIREKGYRFLQKPFSLKDLLQAIKKTLQYG